jgi:hypothetical protein
VGRRSRRVAGATEEPVFLTASDKKRPPELGGRSAFTGSARALDVQVTHELGVLLDELAPRLHLVAHQHLEEL